MLRGGCSVAELEAAIIEAINLKPGPHEFQLAPHKLLRFMSMASADLRESRLEVRGKLQINRAVVSDEDYRNPGEN